MSSRPVVPVLASLLLCLGCPPVEPPEPTPEPTPVECEVLTWYTDADSDGFGGVEILEACEAPPGTSDAGGDCDDGDPTVHPEATEACDGVDRDCSGLIDDLDLDADGHTPCLEPGDCDDTDPAAFPRVVSPTGDDDGLGTPGDPLATLGEAFDTLDEVCRLVYVPEGSSEQSATWVEGSVTIRGVGIDRSEFVAPTGDRILAIEGGTVVLQDMTLRGGDLPNGWGAAISARNSDLTVESVRFTDHAAVLGAAVEALVCNTRFTNVLVDHNRGGAIRAEYGSFESTGSTYEANVGGALAVDYAFMTVSEDRFVDNVDGPALSGYQPHHTLIEGNRFEGNQGPWTSALALNTPLGSLNVVRNNVFVGNGAPGDGSAVDLRGFFGRVQFVNNTIVGTEVGRASSGALTVFVDDADEIVVRSNLIVDTAGGPGMFVETRLAADIAFNTVYGTSGGADFVGPVTAGAADNESRDPLLADPVQGDVSLLPGSPARDSGPPDTEWLDVDGSRNDRGATGGPGGAA